MLVKFVTIFKMQQRFPALAFNVLLTLLAALSRGELVQRWDIINGKPHWHRFANEPYVPVLFPQHEVILQYNCYWMPSICQNARNWMNDLSKSNWASREGPDVFCYDPKSRFKYVFPGINALKRVRIARHVSFYWLMKEPLRH